MFRKENEDLEIKAREFIINAKDEFEKHIPRDKIESIGITDCAEKDGAFSFTGPIAVVSPTGKLKTFGYSAKVGFDADGACLLSDVKISNL